MRRLLAVALFLAASCRTATPPFPTPPEPQDKGRLRERWLFEQRAYPFGSIPSDARRRALDEVRRFRPRSEGEEQSAGVTAASWRPIGPQPVDTYWPWGAASGRVKALAVSPADPSVLLAGSSSGGIWRSTDGGAHFSPVSDDQADLAVGSISFAPSNPQIVYAAMGSEFLGTGVLRSDDGGASWRLVSDSSYGALGTAPRIVIDAANPDRLWIAQYSRIAMPSGQLYAGGVMRSTNGGVSWQIQFRGLIADLVAVGGNSSELLAAVIRDDRPEHGNAGIYRSTNGGLTWSIVLDAGPGVFAWTRLATTAAAPQRVYAHIIQGSTHRVAVSNDRGLTWSDVAADGLPQESSVFIAADPSDPDVVFAGMRDLYRSGDGGTTFENVTLGYTEEGFDPAGSTSHVDQHSIAFRPHVPGSFFLGNDGGVFLTEDGGDSFTSLSGTLAIIQAYGIAAHPTDPARIYLGTQDNGLERRDPDGSWFELITGDYGSILFDVNDDENFATNYIRGNIFAMGHGGNSWTGTLATDATFGEGSQPRIAFIAPFEQLRALNALYFGTWRLFVSLDFGLTWNATAGMTDLTRGGSDTLGAIGLSRSDPSVIYTGSYQGRVMVTATGGVTWDDVSDGLPDRAVRAIAVDPADPDVAWAGFSGYAAEHVWRTDDGGASWQSVSDGLPDVPVNALVIDPKDAAVVYAGTDIGVFRYDGSRWSYFSAGMPPVIVTDFDVTASGRIVAATHGRGAYELVVRSTNRRRGVRH